MRLRQFKKKAPRNTKNEGHICHSQSPSDAERKQKAWGITIYEQGASTSGNPERRTIKRSSRVNLQPSRNGFGSPGKNDKKNDSQKLNLKKVKIKSLEGREIGGQPSKDTP